MKYSLFVIQGVLASMVADAREAQSAGAVPRAHDAENLASALMASYLGAALHFATCPSPRALVDLLAPLLDANLASLPSLPSRRSLL